MKSKRSVLNSLKTRIRSKFNVSVTEVAHHDKWQRTTMGISMISNEGKFLDKTVSAILQLVEEESRVEILDHSVELF